ncbi:MAG TPA: chorismate mutase [Proteobacteria bacterium]|nr:T-protein [bacterium BMS3Abin14]HDL54203.1 chorismate mutase [Pseudomonadota bacterium]
MTDNKQPKTGDLSDRLSGIRSSIDEKDARIIALLQERAGLAMKTGEIKTSLGLPIRDPGREKNILKTIAGAASGPLSADSLQRIFEAVIRECRALEEEER